MYGNLRSRADAPSTARTARTPSKFRRVNLVATQFAKRLALIAFATASLRGLFCEADFFVAQWHIERNEGAAARLLLEDARTSCRRDLPETYAARIELERLKP